MARKKPCAVCNHPQASQILQWRAEGKDEAFIGMNTDPFCSPYDILLHERHEKRESKSQSTSVGASSDKHETIYSRREELKKKLDRVSKLLDQELDSPTSQKGVKDSAQEYRLFTQQLNEIDAEITEQEQKKTAAITHATQMSSGSSIEFHDETRLRIQRYEAMHQICSHCLRPWQEDWMPKVRAVYLAELEKAAWEEISSLSSLTSEQKRAELRRRKNANFFVGGKPSPPIAQEEVVQ